MLSSAHSISRGNVDTCVTDDCLSRGVSLEVAKLTQRDQVPRSAGPDPLPGEKRRGLWCAGPSPQKRYPRPAHRGPLGRSVTIFSSMVRRLFASGSRLPGLMGCSIFMFYHPLNLQKGAKQSAPEAGSSACNGCAAQHSRQNPILRVKKCSLLAQITSSPSEAGKFTQGLSDFALKDGKFI